MATKFTNIALKIEARTKEALAGLKKINDEVDGLAKSGTKLNNSFSVVGKAVGAIFSAYAVRQVADFTIETSKLASKSNDLRKSLKSLAEKEGLDTVKLMQDLRRATDGAISDIDLMKRATLGKFLGIDLKNMPTLLEFASKRARETGEDINYLVESLVTGIGRRSILRLDNLGITMDQIRKEVKNILVETGKWNGVISDNILQLNFQEAAIRVAQGSIKDGAKFTDNAATSLQKMNAQWENLKVLIGEISSGPLASVLEILNNGLQKVNEQISKQGQLDKLQKHLKGINEQIARMESGEKSFADKFASAVGLYGSRLETLKRGRELTLKQIKEIQAELDAINSGGAGSGGSGKPQPDTPLNFNKDQFIPKVDASFRNRNELTLFFDQLKSEFPDMAAMIDTNQLALQSMFDTVDENAPGFQEALMRGTMALEEQQRVALEIGSIIESSFQTLANGLVDSATKGSEAWGDFFDTLKKQITAFLVSEAVKGLLGMFIGAIIPGGSALFGPSIFSKILGGKGSTPAIPAASLTSTPIASIGVPAISTPSMPTRGGMGGGSIINNIVNNRGGNGQIVEVMVRNVPIPQADVRAWLRDANRQILIPDTDTVNQFNRTKKSEFD